MSARCFCMNGHNSSSGRCHHTPEPDHDYCDDCLRECGVTESAAWYITIYLVDQAYGGPEEGGWYYNCGEPVLDAIEGEERQRTFETEREADKYRETLEDLLARLNDGRPEIDSVLSEGRYVAILENDPPKRYPSERPHYE